MLRFFRQLFNREPISAATHTLPPGERLYVIGDVHGRADLLWRIADLITTDLRRYPHAHSWGLFLGDYVDRGSESCHVLDRLAADDFPVRCEFLRGNHEAMLLEFLKDAGAGPRWCQNGGLETLHSYGLDVRSLRTGRGFEDVALAFKEVLPQRHLTFLNQTKASFERGDYFFCHAGVRPGVPLSAQSEEDLLWIREEFIESNQNFGKLIVHGHTPTLEPDIRANRINIDTGAYVTGRLTCLVIEGHQRRFLHTAAQPSR